MVWPCARNTVGPATRSAATVSYSAGMSWLARKRSQISR